MNILLCGSDCQGEYLSRIRDFLSHLLSMRIKVYVESVFASYLGSHGVPLDNFEVVDALPDDVGMVVSMGGDGTILRTAVLIGESTVPVMGINTGHLGYLAGFSLSQLDAVFDALHGHYDVSPRMRLQICSEYLPDDFFPLSLNEISISKGDTTSMVSIHAYLDGYYLADYQADGLIVSTPTGSTAYNMSCGGPILQPTLRDIILSPIAPHSLTLRPLVVSADSELHLVVSSRGEECHVGVDVRTFSIPADGARLIIRRADAPLNLAQPVGFDFSQVLRNKLHWAELPVHR